MEDTRIKNKVNRILKKSDVQKAKCSVIDGIVSCDGVLDSYDEFLFIGKQIAKLNGVYGLVNNIEYPRKKKVTHPSADYSFLKKVDVVIIGAGVVGCCIAHELSQFNLSVVIVEKESDVAVGSTKANNAMVHTGIGEKMGSEKQALCIQGHRLFESLAHQLQVPYKKKGMWIVITTETLGDLPIPQCLRNVICKWILPFFIVHRGEKLGIPLEKIDRERFFGEEPFASKKTLAAIYSPTYAVTCPYLFTIALAENAIENGVELLLDTEVVDLKTKDGRVSEVVTSKGIIKSSLVINAAGVFADDIAQMAKAQEYTIHPKKGATILFDKQTAKFIKHPMSHLKLPKKQHYKGGGVMVTVDENIQWGPTQRESDDKNDVSVSESDLEDIFNRYRMLIPDFPHSKLIAYFTGLRASTFTEDFIIRPARSIDGFIHVAGIQSPGLTAAPAIAKKVLGIIKDMNISLNKKDGFVAKRKKPVVFRDCTSKRKHELVKQNEMYGNIICRCETVTEAEIVNAVHGIVPARTVDAVKRRTRAGMGRCQGGFCLSKVVEIIARERDVSVESVTKKGDDSFLFFGKAKCLLSDNTD